MTLMIRGTPRLRWVNEQALPGAAVEGAERLYRLANMVMFVTCGTGYGFVPVRFGAPPEVALSTLRSVVAPSAEAPSDTLRVDSLLQQYEESIADTTGR